MSSLLPLETKQIPESPPLKKLIGPSFILLGLGLGSGELILWPYLAANFGLGIIWAAVVGITFQFFLNMEIERYTIAKGESIFVGLTRRFGKFSPIFFISATFIPWIWPGIAASSAVMFAKAFGLTYSKYLGIIILLIIGCFLSLGKVIYKTQELTQKLIILIGIPFILFLTFYLSRISDFIKLFSGLIGKGDGFYFLPRNLPIETFLGALAYAGAGGTLNLAQSLYVKEKSYGMTKYASKLTNIFKGEKQDARLEGYQFVTNPQNVKIFQSWWKKINIEHGVVFWLTGAVTMVLLSLLSYVTVFGSKNIQTGINFLLNEAVFIGQNTLPIFLNIFLIMVGLMLFGTQFSVFGSTSRIMSENLVILSKNKFKVENLSKYFFIFLWLQIIAGIIIFSVGFTEPLSLVITGAVLNALSMFIYCGMVLLCNLNLLEKPIKPSIFRICVIVLAFIFYGGFSIFTIVKNLFF